MRGPRLSALATLLTLLAGCAASPPPLLDISNHVCTPAPELISATPVPLGDPLRPDLVKLQIDDTAHCLQTPEGKSLYAAFRLPDSPAPYMIAVRSAPLGQGLFVPRLLLLDGTGAVKREIGRDSLEFRGPMLTALIRSHPDERYLVVASTPKTVGETEAHIVEQTQAATAASGGVYFTVHTGSDTVQTFVYDHGGLITVYAATIPGN